jgi:DNA repair protein SbcC/Rad50
MRLIALTVSGYRQFLAPATILIPRGLTGVCGPNGVGKSKLIEAIGYALYGPRPRLLPFGDRAADLAARADPRAIPEVKLLIEVHGHRYEIVRSPKEASIRLHGAADPLADTVRGVNQKVIELLQLTSEAFRGTFVARQNEIAGLQSLRPEERQRIVNRLIGITQVEQAIKLAQDIKSARNKQYEHTLTGLHLSRAMATEQLDAARVKHSEMIVQQNEREVVLGVATGHAKAIAEQLQALKERQQQAAAYAHELVEIDKHYASAQEFAQEIQRQLAAAINAVSDLAQIEAIIAETDHIPQALEHITILEQRESLRRQYQESETKLNQQLLPELQRRNDLEREIAAEEETIRSLEATAATHKAEAAHAENRAKQAKANASHHEERYKTVEQIGPNGSCEVCGQMFGDGFEQALHNYRDTAAAAHEQERIACEDTIKAYEQERLVREDAQQRQQVQAKRIQAFRELSAVPGEVKTLRAALEDLEIQLDAIPSSLREMVYDSTTHETLRRAAEQRAMAEQRAAHLRRIATEEPALRLRKDVAIAKVAELKAKCEELRTIIDRIQPSQNDIDEVTALDAAAKAAQKSAEQHFHTAGESVAVAFERLERAEEALIQAIAQEQKVAAAQRVVFVADQTEATLRRLLAEIAAEARPRLVELMDSWLRSLIGPRFRMVDLTEDYQLIADNGSGEHTISHFSGGEQTLLAIMLRVAISIFCRERAGFDTSFLILDEVFGNQDVEHRAMLVQFLEEIKIHYHQILIVNHIEDVTGMLDSIIEVSRTGPNTSIVQLRV